MSDNPSAQVVIRDLPTVDYLPMWELMKQFTQQRTSQAVDELWFLQHYPVFTLGQAGKAEHILSTSDIPIINVDRGGQVTYHGPGQLIVYLLIDLKRRSLGVRDLVDIIESSIIDVLQHWGVKGGTRRDAPGVYIDDAKVAALGLRVRKGCSYHGLSLNIDMDLTPFSLINPCGYAGLAVTQLKDHMNSVVAWDDIKNRLIRELCSCLGYTSIQRDQTPWRAFP